jgi:hypothetical protein
MTDSLKVLVTIGASSTLRADIDRFDPRDRAGRIRELATLGLQLERQAGGPLSLGTPPAAPTLTAPPQAPQPTAEADTKAALIERLKQSLQ